MDKLKGTGMMRVLAAVAAIALLAAFASGCAREAADLTCQYCGAYRLTQTVLSQEHGAGVCAREADCGQTGHYVKNSTDGAGHALCDLCGQFKCTEGLHGRGLCVPIGGTRKDDGQAVAAVAPEPTPEPASEPTPEPTVEPASEPTPEPTAESGKKSSDKALNVFTATFPDGSRVDMSRPEDRKPVYAWGADRVRVTARPRDPNATVTGSVGSIRLRPGLNRFKVTVTAEDGSSANFVFQIQT